MKKIASLKYILIYILCRTTVSNVYEINMTLNLVEFKQKWKYTYTAYLHMKPFENLYP